MYTSPPLIATAYTVPVAPSPRGRQKLPVVSQVAKLKSTYIDHALPVIWGEYGAVNQSGYEKYRRYYLEYVTKATHDAGIVAFYWDNGSMASGSEAFVEAGVIAFGRFFPDAGSEAAVKVILEAAAVRPFQAEELMAEGELPGKLVEVFSRLLFVLEDGQDRSDVGRVDPVAVLHRGRSIAAFGLVAGDHDQPPFDARDAVMDRLQLLDKSGLQEEGTQLARRRPRLDAVGVLEEFKLPAAGAAHAEVGLDAPPDVGALANIQELSPLPVEEVDAGGIGQRPDDLPVEMGGAAAGREHPDGFTDPLRPLGSFGVLEKPPERRGVVLSTVAVFAGEAVTGDQTAEVVVQELRVEALRQRHRIEAPGGEGAVRAAEFVAEERVVELDVVGHEEGAVKDIEQLTGDLAEQRSGLELRGGDAGDVAGGEPADLGASATCRPPGPGDCS